MGTPGVTKAAGLLSVALLILLGLYVLAGAVVGKGQVSGNQPPRKNTFKSILCCAAGGRTPATYTHAASVFAGDCRNSKTLH